MESKIALVTGGNKGIGFETAGQLARRGYVVVIGVRDLDRGRAAVESLKKSGGADVHMVRLDTTKPNDPVEAATWIGEKFGRLDVLVNNAGIALERAGVESTDLNNFRQTMETNVIGTVAVTQAFLPLLRKSPAGRIVNVSSGLGSLTLGSDSKSEFFAVKPAAYNASKAALNMLTVILAAELRDTPIKVNSADPGFTATDLNGNSGYQTVAEGSEAIVKLATLPPDGPTGGYFSRHGPVAW